MACPPATARTLKGLSRPSGRRCDRRSRGATTARDTDDASLHGEGQVREDSTPARETATLLAGKQDFITTTTLTVRRSSRRAVPAEAQ